MRFIHPEYLYALVILIIPVLVHLFQLRRFRKQKFTNVKFLKQAVLKTRKSSQIKKWLILTLRILILACLVLAFSQPYFPSSEPRAISQETVIYLDNSYSLQAKGSNGILLKRSIQDLLESIPETGSVSMFTNNADLEKTDYALLKKEMGGINYSPNQLSWAAVSLRAGNLFSSYKESQKNLIVISDFQKKEGEDSLAPMPGVKYQLVQVKPENPVNLAIDTAYISQRSLDGVELSLKISRSLTGPEEVSVSVYDGLKLLAKRTITFPENNFENLIFNLSGSAVEKGRIEIEDSGLEFDNKLYFSINEIDPIKVAVVGDGDTSFLQRIYRAPEFELSSSTVQSIDYNKLSSANLIILNEIKEIPPSFSRTLADLVKSDMYLVIIPSQNPSISKYNTFLTELGAPGFQEKREQERLISEIAYDNPLFREVFEEQTENFQYPLIQSYHRLNGSAETILGLDNGDGLLVRTGNIFLFTASLAPENSNFQNAPLIVPTFYNFGNLSLTPTPLYYNLGEPQKIDVDVNLEKDEILSITSNSYSFIPRQQNSANKVILQLDNDLQEAGHYFIQKDSLQLKSISFNIDRKENRLEYHDLKSIKGIKIASSITSAFKNVESQTEIDALWKWFVIFALFFLLIEMFLLKFIK